MRRRFRLLDVFSAAPCMGNPLAVVLDAAGLTDDEMARFARWMNLSETTFVLPADDPAADYRVRIFTPVEELPFAGHPTIGTCHAWLEAGGRPHRPGIIVQECGAGLIQLQRVEGRLAFAAPPLRRSGPADEATIARIASVLRIDRTWIVAAEWVDNGPGWVAALLPDADTVLRLQPGFVDFDLGVVGPYPPGSPFAFEVRAFFPKDGATVEDPVTGSLNASLGQWLVASGRATLPYVASQGGALGRAGRVYVSGTGAADIQVGGDAATRIAGEVDL